MGGANSNNRRKPRTADEILGDNIRRAKRAHPTQDEWTAGINASLNHPTVTSSAVLQRDLPGLGYYRNLPKREEEAEAEPERAFVVGRKSSAEYYAALYYLRGEFNKTKWPDARLPGGREEREQFIAKGEALHGVLETLAISVGVNKEIIKRIRDIYEAVEEPLNELRLRPITGSITFDDLLRELRTKRTGIATDKEAKTDENAAKEDQARPVLVDDKGRAVTPKKALDEVVARIQASGYAEVLGAPTPQATAPAFVEKT